MAYDELRLRNARAVVEHWNTGEHLKAWNKALADRGPAEVTMAAARAWEQVRDVAEDEADSLTRIGYLENHEEVVGLRRVATNAQRRVVRLYEWAAHLEVAEGRR